MRPTDDFEWETRPLKIHKVKKCDHDKIVEQELTEFGSRFYKNLAAIELVITGLGIATGYYEAAFGFGIIALPVVYLLCSDTILSIASELNGDPDE